METLRRYASFIATSNHYDVFTDTSGSRRFICVRLTGPIKSREKINHDQLYAQAMHEIKRGERYWFEGSEEAILSATKIIHSGRILHKHQIPSKRTQTGTIYHVVEK